LGTSIGLDNIIYFLGLTLHTEYYYLQLTLSWQLRCGYF
jgi:hypothetical protein